MLKSVLRRPLTLRQFPASSSTWNLQQRRASDLPKGGPSNSQPPPVSVSEEPRPSQNGTKENVESLSPNDLALVKQRIGEWTEQAMITLRNRADGFTESTKTTFHQLGSHLNSVTGYEQIEALKRGVVEQEERINATRQAARKAKAAYEEAVVQRSKSQREVNDLLQRKSSWLDSDVGRFTTLVRQDHLFEQEELRAKAAVEETDNSVDREFNQLMRLILARYHEEQVWSDKIRSASTYGSLAALGLNMLIFILAIVAVEPWKRRRLAQTFERKIEELSHENQARLEASMNIVSQQIARQEDLLEGLKSGVPISREIAIPNPSAILMSNVIDQPSKYSRWHWEVALVGGGAFFAGVLSSLIFSH